jgi:hypothetical protein
LEDLQQGNSLTSEQRRSEQRRSEHLRSDQPVSLTSEQLRSEQLSSSPVSGSRTSRTPQASRTQATGEATAGTSLRASPVSGSQTRTQATGEATTRASPVAGGSETQTGGGAGSVKLSADDLEQAVHADEVQLRIHEEGVPPSTPRRLPPGEGRGSPGASASAGRVSDFSQSPGSLTGDSEKSDGSVLERSVLEHSDDEGGDQEPRPTSRGILSLLINDMGLKFNHSCLDDSNSTMCNLIDFCILKMILISV